MCKLLDRYVTEWYFCSNQTSKLPHEHHIRIMSQHSSRASNYVMMTVRRFILFQTVCCREIYFLKTCICLLSSLQCIKGLHIGVSEMGFSCSAWLFLHRAALICSVILISFFKLLVHVRKRGRSHFPLWFSEISACEAMVDLDFAWLQMFCCGP